MWFPSSTKHSSVRITSSKLTMEPQRNTLPLYQINRTKEMEKRKKEDQLWKSLLLIFYFFSLIFIVRLIKTSPAQGFPGDSCRPFEGLRVTAVASCV